VVVSLSPRPKNPTAMMLRTAAAGSARRFLGTDVENGRTVST
jgi:hypothetical protein